MVSTCEKMLSLMSDQNTGVNNVEMPLPTHQGGKSSEVQRQLSVDKDTEQ